MSNSRTDYVIAACAIMRDNREVILQECSIDECTNSGGLRRGMCGKHYRAWFDRTPKEKRGLPPRARRRFDDFVQVGPNGRCWTWIGPTDRGGYGRWGKKLAHRVAFRAANGSIPDGLWVLHRCDNPPCVNPMHLYAGTASENIRDAFARGRHPGIPLKHTTHCAKGHELTGRNLELVGKTRTRRCRICYNESSAAWQREQRRKRGLMKTKVSAEERARMIELHAEGNSYRKIAGMLGRGVCTVGIIVKESKDARAA